ncbi:MAG TPA: HAD-IA family hydrolase, partial [Longimicrobiales bacterium]
VLFDAGGTLIHMDRRFVIQKLNEQGIAATLDDFARADIVARNQVTRVLRSAQPGDDSSRWVVYAGALMRELKCEGAALARVREEVWSRHAVGDLWTYVLDGTFDVLASLRDSGYRMGIVSNADGRVATFLEKAGLLPYFEFIVDSGIFGIEKPDRRIFEHALGRLGVAPAEAIYVGDVYDIDVLGARAAGMPAVLLNGAESDPGWDCPVIESLVQLPALLATPGELRAAARGAG